MKPFILGINASPRKSGQIGEMLNVSLNELNKHGAKTQVINLVEKKIMPHSGILDNKQYIEKTKDDMPALQKLILQADGVIFATPTHWFGPSSLMKLFIDRLTSLEHFDFLLEGKVGGIITYGPQGGSLSNTMNMLMILNQWGMVVPPYGALFNEGRKDKWFKDDLKLLAKNMLVAMKHQNDSNWGYPGNKYKSSPIELLK